MLRSEANLLKQQLIALADILVKQEEIIVAEADRQGISVLEMRHANGEWVLVDILTAKAHVWSALAIISKEN